MAIVKYGNLKALMFSACSASPSQKHAIAAARASHYELPPEAEFCCLYCGGWSPKEKAEK
jgi:hypothetical protein